MKKLKEIKSIVCVLLAGCMWGCMGLLVRPLNKLGLQSMDIVALRSFVTAFLTIICSPLLCKISKEASIREVYKVRLKDIWVFLGTGIVSVVFFNFCYFNTIIYTSLSVAAIMLYTAPIFVMLFSMVIFKDRINRKKIIALIFAFAGCGIVTGAFTGNLVLDVRGLLFGLGAGIGYALYSIFGKLASDRHYSSITITLYTFLFASVGVLPFINIREITNILMDNGGILYTLALIIITTFLPYIFYTVGLSQMEPGKASVVACIEPVMASMVGLFAFGEPVKLVTIIGVCLVIVAIVIINSKDRDDIV